MTFSDTGMMELGIALSTNIHNIRSLIRTLKYVKIIFFFCADMILQQWYSPLMNFAVYYEYDTRPHKCIELLKS